MATNPYELWVTEGVGGGKGYFGMGRRHWAFGVAIPWPLAVTRGPASRMKDEDDHRSIGVLVYLRFTQDTLSILYFIPLSRLKSNLNFRGEVLDAARCPSFIWHVVPMPLSSPDFMWAPLHSINRRRAWSARKWLEMIALKYCMRLDDLHLYTY